MVRKLATIREIKELVLIDGADRIERATVDGWHVVVERGLHKVGDRIIYCEIDSILPEKPEFEFLRQRNFRIKTIKLRGQISQGLVLPMSMIYGKRYSSDTRENPIYDFQIGTDVTELMEIVKYEPKLPIHLHGLAKGKLPTFIPRTDEERIQNILWILDIFKGKQFYISEKLDGTSMTCYYKDGEFGICSRNLDLKETEENLYWKVAKQYKIDSILKNINMSIAIQGELIGEGIQGNPYKLKGQEFRVFNVFDIVTGKYFEYEDLRKFIYDNNLLPVPMYGNNFILNHTIEQLLSDAEGTSMVNDNNLNIQREGLVIRTTPEAYHILLGRVSFKVISNKYLLKNKE